MAWDSYMDKPGAGNMLTLMGLGLLNAAGPVPRGQTRLGLLSPYAMASMQARDQAVNQEQTEEMRKLQLGLLKRQGEQGLAMDRAAMYLQTGGQGPRAGATPLTPAQAASNPQFLGLLMQADPKGAIDLMTKEPRRPQVFGSGETGFYSLGPDGKPQQLLAGRDKEDKQLVEVYDPNSPSGTSWIPRSEASGKPGKPTRGLRMEVNKDGTVTVTDAPITGGAQDLTKKSLGDVEEKIIKSGDTLASLTAIKAQFKPEFQQIGTRWNNLVTSLKDKAGMGVSEPDKAALQEFTAYRAQAGQLFALTLKDLSGVAVNPTEFKRAEAWLPNPGSGLFDGDSPTELQSKIQRFEDFTRKALAKAAYIKKNGLTVDKVDVEDMPRLMRQRGDALAAELSKQGLQGDQLREAVKYRLADEFGMVAR
jgi:hypothetical protein